MPQHLRGVLEKMLDEYDERRRAALELERNKRAAEESFLARFAELRRTVVRPVFEEAGAVLSGRGHGFRIAEQEFSGEGGRVTEASITLEIEPAGMPPPLRPGDHERSFSISTRFYNKTVWINAGRPLDSGGFPGSKGAYSVERVDRPLVEEALLAFIAGVVKG